MKRILPPLALAASLIAATAFAQDAPDQAMLEKLFGVHEDLESIESALEEAAEKNLHQQTLDEALLLYRRTGRKEWRVCPPIAIARMKSNAAQAGRHQEEGG